MSQRDLLTELRAARVDASPELRARVRLIAAQAPPQRRLTRRRVAFGLALAPALAAVIAGAVVLSTRPAHRGATAGHAEAGRTLERPAQRSATQAQAAPAPARTRVQRYGASLQLRVPTPQELARAVERALGIAAALGGHPATVHVASASGTGDARVVLRIPRAHVQQAITRLAQLGTVVGEQVDIQDLQAGINATDRTIARLQRQLAQQRAIQPQTDQTERRIAQLTQQVVSLQRARAGTIRAAHFATVRLSFTTPPRPHRHATGFLHDVRTALPWLGLGAVVLLVLVALRGFRRRREEALLSRP
jgi:hypothetical protein